MPMPIPTGLLILLAGMGAVRSDAVDPRTVRRSLRLRGADVARRNPRPMMATRSFHYDGERRAGDRGYASTIVYGRALAISAVTSITPWLSAKVDGHDALGNQSVKMAGCEIRVSTPPAKEHFIGLRPIRGLRRLRSSRFARTPPAPVPSGLSGPRRRFWGSAIPVLRRG